MLLFHHVWIGVPHFVQKPPLVFSVFNILLSLICKSLFPLLSQSTELVNRFVFLTIDSFHLNCTHSTVNYFLLTLSYALHLSLCCFIPSSIFFFSGVSVSIRLNSTQRESSVYLFDLLTLFLSGQPTRQKPQKKSL